MYILAVGGIFDPPRVTMLLNTKEEAEEARRHQEAGLPSDSPICIVVYSMEVGVPSEGEIASRLTRKFPETVEMRSRFLDSSRGLA